MTQSLEIRSVEEIDIRKEIAEMRGRTVSSPRLTKIIIKKYGLWLDEHQEHSLKQMVNVTLRNKEALGEVRIVVDGRPIRYLVIR
jgi:hypothetical protein